MATGIINKVKTCFLYTSSSLILVACGGGGGGGSGGGSGGLLDPQLGTATADWSMPGTRENGDILTGLEIEYYRLLIGLDSGQYFDDFIIDAPSTSVTVNDVPVGTYFAVVTAVDTDGRESQFSSEFQVLSQ